MEAGYCSLDLNDPLTAVRGILTFDTASAVGGTYFCFTQKLLPATAIDALRDVPVALAFTENVTDADPTPPLSDVIVIQFAAVEASQTQSSPVRTLMLPAPPDEENVRKSGVMRLGQVPAAVPA